MHGLGPQRRGEWSAAFGGQSRRADELCDPAEGGEADVDEAVGGGELTPQGQPGVGRGDRDGDRMERIPSDKREPPK